MTQSDPPPQAKARLTVIERTRGEPWIFEWVILCCPLCGQTHRHGGGEVLRDDPRRHLGHRAKHCLHSADARTEYTVIDERPRRTDELLHSLAEAFD